MSFNKPPPYLLLQLPDITEPINYPIRNVKRNKYTCFDVSRSLIAFGAISGGIYVFNRSPCEFIQLIPNKDGAITRLAISSNEKHIGFANGRGTVTVTSCDQSLSGGHNVVTSKDHQGNEVTAMVWSETNMLFSGDDIGKVSVLQLQNFIAKTFQNSSQIIMSLDSRICQIDTRSCMLLVSTLTRCYVCDTSQEQYRQIGQKLRDGDFGACFVNTQKSSEVTSNRIENDFTELKKYNMVNDESKFAVGKELENTLIFCARPSSRLWEATVDGTVKRTHQFKQVLARNSMPILTKENYEAEQYKIEHLSEENEGKSINFSKIYSMNSAIFCFRKDALYFLNIDNVDNTVWYEYKDIADCKVYHDMLYIWLNNGSLVNYRYMKIDKFLLMCYVEEKYALCAKMCAFYSEFLISNNISPKMNILVGLKDKVEDKNLLNNISEVLAKFESLKSVANQIKSGIYVVDNTYNAQTSLEDDDKRNDDYKFAIPETMQTLKELSFTVSDKLNNSKKMLKEKWEDFEDKMKHMGEKSLQEIPRDVRNVHDEIIEHVPVPVDNDVIYKESSQKAIEEKESDNNIITIENDKLSKNLYQHSRLSLVGNADDSNLISIIESNACDIRGIYNLMLKLEQYCVNISAIEESKFIPNNLFLSYLNISDKRDNYLEDIINDEELYKYFVDSCIIVNMKTQKLANIGCECGFPLPYARTNQTPIFSELIDKFIEMQWSSPSQNQCYDICKRMPYLWRKILYLRRNEDLMNVLRILLQILDENLLHSFLPQFTLNIWNKAVQLYATLYSNICLNCSRKFDNICVRDTLSWDDLGALMIKSIGGRNSIKMMENYANLIDSGAITVKFYHTCLIVTMFETYDATVTAQLTDALYSSYDYVDSKLEICKLLRNNMNGQVNNTALPIVVAAQSNHWGLTPLETNLEQTGSKIKYVSLQEIAQNLFKINNGVTDCALCGLPLQNEVLIKDGGLWVFKCGHTFHGACLDLNKVRLCPSCSTTVK